MSRPYSFTAARCRLVNAGIADHEAQQLLADAEKDAGWDHAGTAVLTTEYGTVTAQYWQGGFTLTIPYEPSVTPRIYAKSIGSDTGGREHKALRDAIDGANVSGTITWIKNTAGAPVAAIVPVDIAEGGLRDRRQP
jgi:hypothetical protein